MPFAVGIDVAGTKRGHHGVALDLGSRRLVECWAWPDEHAALAALAGLEGLMAVAIDAPPAAHRMGVRVREAEVELARKRVRPQWTPAPGGRAQPWMENGERLWQALRRGLPGVAMIETFPTAAVQLGRRPMDVSLPLEFVRHAGFNCRKDVLDAAVAAWVAASWLEGAAECAGKGSPDGEIWY